MEPTKPLKRRLERAAKRYLDGRGVVPVSFESGTAACAKPDGSIVINPEIYDELPLEIDPANEYRLLRKTTAHEVMHINRSVLTGKADFADAYPGLEQLAGAVCNILEDRYVDHWVRTEYPGLRSVYAYERSVQMDSDEQREPMGDIKDGGDEHGIEQRVEGLCQLCLAGWVKGYEDAEEDVQEFFARQKVRIEGIEKMHDPEEREKLMHDVMEDLASSIPEEARERAEEMAEVREMLMEALEEILVNGGAGPVPDTPEDAGGDGPEDMDPRDVEDIEDMDFEPPEDSMNYEPPEFDGLDEKETVEMSAEELSEMDDGDTEDNATTQFDVQLDERLDEASDRDERAVSEILEEVENRQSGHEERLAERDERVERGIVGHSGGHEDIRKLGEERGVIEDVRKAFDDMASADGDPLAESGYRVDIDQVVERASGNLGVTELHREQEVTETGDRAVNVAVDLSGSMDGRPIKQAKLAIATLATACEEIGDQFCASGFDTTGMPKHEPENQGLYVINGPDEDFEWGHLDSVNAGGAEPTFAGVNDGVNLLDRCSRTDKLMFVITDGKATAGKPGSSAYGDGPVEDAREAVNAAREEGITVVGLGIGGINERDLTKTFGSSSYVATGINSLADDLIEQYERTLETTV